MKDVLELTRTNWAADIGIVDWVVALGVFTLARVVQDLSLVTVGSHTWSSIHWPPPLSIVILLTVHDALVAERSRVENTHLETSWAAFAGEDDRGSAGEWRA